MSCVVYRIGRGASEIGILAEGFLVTRKYAPLIVSAIDSLVLYYRARETSRGGVYVACAVIRGLRHLPGQARYLKVDVSDYAPLARAVHLVEGGLLHERIFNGHQARSVANRWVRAIPEAEAGAILEDSERYRFDGDDGGVTLSATGDVHGAFAHPDQAPYAAPGAEGRYHYSRHPVRLPLRALVAQLYAFKCMSTSIEQPLAPKGWEAECCHFVPLSRKGPDIVQNVGMITASMHRLYDAGLLALSDDYRILVKDCVHPRFKAILNEDGHAHVPDDPCMRPARALIAYHRQAIFGAAS